MCGSEMTRCARTDRKQMRQHALRNVRRRFLERIKVPCRPDLWRADGLGHPVKDHDALTAAAGKVSPNSVSLK
jgi:hypothetical protein